jgi:hypothetical protein
MFVFVATALAGTLIGWPCQRLNWGWRNVWSTCSINSYAPQTGGPYVEPPTQVPTGFRLTNTIGLPSIVLTASGWYAPSAGAPTATLPSMLCANAMATGTGATANLRNRCRRAIDAYGALVRTCQLPPQTAGNRGPSGPNSVSPDYAPQLGHAPHVSNVQGLTQNAQFCTLPAGAHTPADLNTPSNTCPGLLGWFTVVFNACGFSNAPGLAPALTSAPVSVPWTSNYFPIGGVATAAVIPTGAVSPVLGAGYFCAPIAGPMSATGGGPSTGPSSWNVYGTYFRTSRCRKALDQFGRTAQRCHQSTAPASGPAQAGGWTDPLRLLAVGSVAAGTPTIPNGINSWAPACNA